MSSATSQHLTSTLKQLSGVTVYETVVPLYVSIMICKCKCELVPAKSGTLTLVAKSVLRHSFNGFPFGLCLPVCICCCICLSPFPSLSLLIISFCHLIVTFISSVYHLHRFTMLTLNLFLASAFDHICESVLAKTLQPRLLNVQTAQVDVDNTDACLSDE